MTKPNYPLTLEKFKKILSDGMAHEFKIVLNGGAYSRKTIYLRENGRYSILNHIDDSRQTLTEKALFDESRTNIGKAINLNSLYQIKD